MSIWADVRKLGLGIATIALGFLIVVLLVAAASRLWVAMATSLAAMLAFNFFFLPPIGTLAITVPQNWIALFAFLAVSLVASNLSAVARMRTHEAETRRDELGRLFELSRDVLLITDSAQANASLAGFISRRFELDSVVISLPHGEERIEYRGGSQELALEPRQLAAAFASADLAHQILTLGAQPVRLVPLRIGNKPIGVLAVAGRPIERGTLDAVAGLAAIAIDEASVSQ
jgi:two-component system sensor histidine kinase KdpD